MANRLYGTLWRWHFLAGVVSFPIIFVVAITGALYTFQPELDRLANPALLEVEPRGERQSLDTLVAAASQVCTSRGVLAPHEPDRSVIVFCKDDHEAYLDPYSGQLLGARDLDRSFFGVVFDLHWDLMLGKPGQLLVEWATSWALVLMVTGVVLWWPRGRRRLAGVWWPRRQVGARQVLRDLHAVTGAYLLPVLLALTATGLTWTLYAGDERWRPLTRDAASQTWEAPPRSTVVTNAPRIGYEAALAAARGARGSEPLAVYASILTRPDEAYSFLVYDDSWQAPTASWSAWVDAYSGRPLAHIGWEDHSALGKVNQLAYPIHIGSVMGLPGRIAACLGALVLAALCVTGPWMWWKRRPRGELGIPPRKRAARWPLLVLAAGVGWLLPLVGVTLLAALAFEGVRWYLRS